MKRAGVMAMAAASLWAGAAQANAVSDGEAGMAALNKGDNAQAVRLFTRALSSGTLSRSDRELAYVKRAEAYAAENNKTLALADLEHALKLDPQDQEATNLRKQLQSGGGPTLLATLDFIGQRLNQQGPMVNNFAVHDAVLNMDWTATRWAQFSYISGDPANCQLSYHVKIVDNDIAVQADTDAAMALGDVVKVEVLTLSQSIDRGNAIAGNPNRSTHGSPEVFVVKAIRANGASNDFDLVDQASAASVAKALTHAAQLCGRTGAAVSNPLF